jgi:hypothetical protein
MSSIYRDLPQSLFSDLNVLVLNLIDHDARVGRVGFGRGEGRRSNNSRGRVCRRAGRRWCGCGGGGYDNGRRSRGCNRRSGRSGVGGSSGAGGNSGAGSSRGARSRAQRRGAVDLRDNPRRGVVGVKLKVVQVVGNGASAGANWVASCAVGAENRCITVETGKVFGLAAVGLLACAVKYVVGLVGSVHNITPEESGTN